MPPSASKNDEYEFDSSDAEDFIQVLDSSMQGTKRKSMFDDGDRPIKKPAIAHPEALSIAIKALKMNFGLMEFRLKQKNVIARILAGESAVAVFPTGGGKSLCYQLPALVFSDIDRLMDTRGQWESGITLVVSPLLALMKDQVDALVKRGIKAATIDSTKSREEYLHTCEMLRNGELKLLYCAPERLNNEGFVEQMKCVRGGIRLLAVDEAHCISEWGHAFRPDYLKISRFVDEIKAERVLCLTATATPRVATDICNAFKLDETQGLFRTSTYRPNLRLLAVSAKTKQELYPQLFSFLRHNPGPSIVYVTLQKQTVALADDLRNQSFKAESFHAGMDSKVKADLQDRFMKCDNLIIVATIAFGMGIDKSNIRNIVHFNIPNSLESYSQEIGRAGRDGLTSNCIFYLCGEDLHLREIFARGDLPSLNSLTGILRQSFDQTVSKFPIGAEIKLSLPSQQKEFDIRPSVLQNIYAQLELTHGLIRATTPIYTKYTFAPKDRYSSTLAHDLSPAATAIRANTKHAKTLYHVDLAAAEQQSRLPRVDMVKKLTMWNEEGIIELKPSGVLNVFKVTSLLPTKDDEIETIAKSIFATMERREHEAIFRTDQILKLVTSPACFSRSLAQHFGDDLSTDRGIECGHCTWCNTHNPIVMHTPPAVTFDRHRFNAVLERVKARDDARFLARVAFGISSPRVTVEKFGHDAVFGSMEDHEFMDLLREFTKECEK